MYFVHLFLSYLQAVLIRILQVMDVDVDIDDQKRKFKNVIDNFFFFSVDKLFVVCESRLTCFKAIRRLPRI